MNLNNNRMELKDLYQNYDVLMMHGTRLNGGADINPCISRNASVIQRIISVINSNSTISCFSFCVGLTLRNLFSPVGLILRSGWVVDADNFDLGSSVNHNCDRICEDPRKPIGDQVHDAITNRNYINEFLIKEHQMCAIYLCTDDLDYLSVQVDGIENFCTALRSIKLPIIIIEQGNTFEGEFNSSCGLIRRSRITISEFKIRYCGC